MAYGQSSVTIIIVLLASLIIMPSSNALSKDKTKSQKSNYETAVVTSIEDPEDIQPATKKKLFAFWKKAKAAIVSQNKTAYANLFHFDEDGYNHSYGAFFTWKKKDFIVAFDDFFDTWYRQKLKVNIEDPDEFIYSITNKGEIRAELWLKLGYDLRQYMFQIYEDGNWYLENIFKKS